MEPKAYNIQIENSYKRTFNVTLFNWINDSHKKSSKKNKDVKITIDGSEEEYTNLVNMVCMNPIRSMGFVFVYRNKKGLKKKVKFVHTNGLGIEESKYILDGGFIKKNSYTVGMSLYIDTQIKMVIPVLQRSKVNLIIHT